MLSDERTREILKEINVIAENAKWTWTQRDMYLGSCFTRSKYLQSHFVKTGKTIHDILESWKTEPLRVECKTGLHIIFVYLCIEEYGIEFFDDLDKLNYTEMSSNTTFFFSLPLTSKLAPVEDGKISDVIFPSRIHNRFDYVYLKGIKAYDHRSRYFPKLTPSFQGENLIVLNPDKQLYIGFWHRGDGGKFLVRRKEDIQKDLLKKGRQDFRDCYPEHRDRLSEPDNLGLLAGEGQPVLTILSWTQVFEPLDGGSGYKIRDNHRDLVLARMDQEKNRK